MLCISVEDAAHITGISSKVPSVSLSPKSSLFGFDFGTSAPPDMSARSTFQFQSSYRLGNHSDPAVLRYCIEVAFQFTSCRSCSLRVPSDGHHKLYYRRDRDNDLFALFKMPRCQYKSKSPCGGLRLSCPLFQPHLYRLGRVSFCFFHSPLCAERFNIPRACSEIVH